MVHFFSFSRSTKLNNMRVDATGSWEVLVMQLSIYTMLANTRSYVIALHLSEVQSVDQRSTLISLVSL